MVPRTSLKKLIDDDILLNNWEDITCPICLDVPHNGVLLHCTSYDRGCRAFLCDTDQTHSNCLSRFRSASGGLPSCPLCRGEVTGWDNVKEVCAYLNMKTRCCQEQHCSYSGNFIQLQSHMQLKHPHSCPSEIDPAHQLDWENFQQSSAIIDVLSTIHAEVPHGVVLGDYVIEYGNDDGNEDDYDAFRRRGGKWWSSCIFYQVFGRFRGSRNQGRTSGRTARGGGMHRSASVGSIEGSPSSTDASVYRFHEAEDEFPGLAASSDHITASSGFVGRRRRSYRRRRRRNDD